MKNFKQSVLRIALASVLAIGAASSVIAAVPAPVGVGGGVAAITLLTQTGVGPRTVKPGELNVHPIAIGTINSNTPKGFEISVVSTNMGVMVRGGGSASEIGDAISYTAYELKKTAGGKIGAGALSVFAKHPLAEGDVGTATFKSGAVTSATVDQPYELVVEFTPSDRLLSGDYSDTITLTMVSGS